MFRDSAKFQWKRHAVLLLPSCLSSIFSHLTGCFANSYHSWPRYSSVLKQGFLAVILHLTHRIDIAIQYLLLT